jgi:hypothetical protein
MPTVLPAPTKPATRPSRPVKPDVRPVRPPDPVPRRHPLKPGPGIAPEPKD